MINEKDHVDIENQYWRLAELWRFYLDLIVKVNVFFTGVAGSLVAYVIGGRKDDPEIEMALLLPFLLSCGFFIISFRGIRQSRELERSMNQIAAKISLAQPIHASLLREAITLTAAFYGLSSLGIGLLPFIRITQ